ncbi:MAG TPA: hypothetical protein VIH16_03865, partial [Bellilinea sp.]
MRYNNLSVQILDSTGQIQGDNLDHLTGISFGTIYPGGLYGSFSCFVPRNITHAWQVTFGNIIRAYNGLKPVWEGRITSLTPVVNVEGHGIAITAFGYWADVLMARKLRKPWCDTRIGQDVWPEAIAWDAADITLKQNCTVDRLNRIRFTPKNVAWALNDYHRVLYLAPAGQTIKRITCSYDFQEAAQVWNLAIYSGTSAPVTNLANITVSGTGTIDHTLVTPNQGVNIIFRALAAQTPPSDGTIYGQMSNLKVYTETGSINLTEIAKDVRAVPSELSADVSLIGSNTFVTEPFIADPPKSLADILMDAAGYGDASYNAWAVGIRSSHLASDSKPILFVEQQPVLTDYDYALRVDETNVVGQLSFSQNVEDVRNYILVQYETSDGAPAYLTPDDDTTLKDATSITSYGERHELITVRTSVTAKAANVARRILAARKNAQWR